MAINNPTTKETVALAFSGIGSWVSLHTGDPGTTGANEATGAPYARKQTVWTGGTADGVVNGSEVTIDVPAGTYTWAAIWKTQAGTAATDFVEKVAISSTAYTGAGQMKVTPKVTVT